VVVLSFLATFAGLVQVAQAQASRRDRDRELRRLANGSYDLATRTERDGFEDHAHGGGPGTELLRLSQQDCVPLALSSYQTLPSRLAAWRTVSCASGIGAWLVVYFAEQALRSLDPAGIEGWAPGGTASVSPEEVARVRNAVADASRHIGAVRLPTGALSWPASGAPLVLEAGALPPGDVDLSRGPMRVGPVQVGDLVYMPVGAAFSVIVTTPSGPQEFRATVRALAEGGPQTAEIVPPPVVVAPVVDLTPETTTVEAVDEALAALQPLLDRCAQSSPVTAMIEMTINSTGDVREAHPLAPSSGANCLAQVVLTQLVMPPFRRVAQSITVRVQAEPAAAALPPVLSEDAAPTHSGGSLGLPILTMSAGVAAAVAGGVFWYLAAGIRDDLDASCPTRTGCDPALRADADRGKSYTLTGNILAIGGAGFAVLGVVWIIVAAAGSDEPALRSSMAHGRLSAGISPTAHGGAVTLEGSF
jgi:hypothetical protein